MNALGSGVSGSVHYRDTVALDVVAQVDAYLNCYYQQADGAIIKIFPNRYSTRYWVYAGQNIELPNDKRFQIQADSLNATEGFMCLASSEDIMSKLPESYRANMFQRLPVQNFDAMYELYREASQANLVGRVVSYEIQ